MNLRGLARNYSKLCAFITEVAFHAFRCNLLMNLLHNLHDEVFHLFPVCKCDFYGFHSSRFNLTFICRFLSVAFKFYLLTL